MKLDAIGLAKFIPTKATSHFNVAKIISKKKVCDHKHPFFGWWNLIIMWDCSSATGRGCAPSSDRAVGLGNGGCKLLKRSGHNQGTRVYLIAPTDSWFKHIAWAKAKSPTFSTSKEHGPASANGQVNQKCIYHICLFRR